MNFTPEEIKNLRIKMMLSQTEFAKLLGVTFESVNRYENGRSRPTFRVQRMLVKLNVKLKGGRILNAK